MTARRGRVVAIVLAAVLAATTATTAIVIATRGSDTVATIDGHAVSREELLFHMRRLAPTVQNALQVQLGETGSAVDWSDEVDGEVALDRLRDAALAEIYADKTLMILAQENGLIDSVDYDAFRAELDAENAARQSGVAAGETVYGLTEFSADEYYTHTLAELRTGLLDALGSAADSPIAVDEAEISAYYAEHAGDWQANATTYRYSVLIVPAGSDPTATTGVVAAAGNLSAASALLPGSSVATATLGGEVPVGPSGHDQEILAALSPLQPGQVSPATDAGGELTYYQLDAVSVDDALALQTYSSRIEQTLLDEGLDALLDDRLDNDSVDENDPVLHSITPEELSS